MTSNVLKNFTPGTVIVKENTAGSEMYIILQGSAGVYKNYQEDDEILLATLGAGNFFGEMSLFLGKERSATIVALDNVSTMFITNSSAAEVFSSKPDIIFSMLRELCKRIDTLNIDYAKVRDQLESGYIISSEKKTNAPKTQAKNAKQIFPSEHGFYELTLCNPTSDKLFSKPHACPICDTTFRSLAVAEGFRKPKEILPTLRAKYADIEALHYQIGICPSCYFAADFDTKAEVFSLNLDARKREKIRKTLAAYRKGTELKTEKERNTDTVFAGYYLAIICAQLCFEKDYHHITAELYQELSWLYEDCDDGDQTLWAAEKAVIDYKAALANPAAQLSDRQKQRIYYSLGDLYERLGEYNNAVEFFDLARKVQGAAIAINMMAMKRLEALEKFWQR